MKKLYVGNLPYETDEESLKAMFAEYGDIASVTIITDRATGRSKGFGFVEFENDEEADKAIEGLNETEVGGRNIKVSVARPKRE